MTTNTETHSLPVRSSIDPVAGGLLGGLFFCLCLAAVQLKTLVGLPAHPLLLHVPVVLIPILSGAAIALMVRPDWRRRYGVAAALLALVALAFTILAANAGEAFRESRPVFASPALNEHAELGDQLKAVMVLFAGGLVGFVAADLLRGPGRLAQLARLLHRPPLERLVRLGIAALAVVALVWVVRTGHEGAKVAWEQPSPLHAHAARR